MATKKDLEGLVEGDLIELKYFPGPRFLYKEKLQPFYFVEYAVEEGAEIIKVIQDKIDSEIRIIPLDKVDKITKYVVSKQL